MSMHTVMSISTVSQALSSLLVTAFGILALVLMAVGIFGVTSYSIAQRTQEIGVRMALGASRANAVMLLLRQSMATVAVGLVIGVVGALAAARLLGGMLFGVPPSDPLVYGSAVGLLLVVSVAATLLPARRATAIGPLDALKYE
jgi:ABC-type antimicrobial peptide transport system permease subunit